MGQHAAYLVKLWRAANPSRSGNASIGRVLRVEVEDVRNGDRHVLKGAGATAFAAALEAARTPAPGLPRPRAVTTGGRVVRVARGTPAERSTSTMAS